MLRSRMSITALVLALSFLLTQAPGYAQTTAAGSVAGKIVDSQQNSVAGALVALVGPSNQTTSSDAQGAFRFASVPGGLYSLSVTKAGFVGVTRDDVTVLPGQTTSVTVALSLTSFSSLREIGRVSVSSRGAINISPAAVTEITAQTFADQGKIQTSKIFNETPGIVATYGGGNVNGEINGSAPGTFYVPQIRGALPYETQSLIDGHPVSSGFRGAYLGQFVDVHALQNVEIVRGPGAVPDNIAYALMGSVNYRTLEPTLKRRASIELGIDRWGGQSSDYQMTGTTGDGHLGYALDYAINGTPGPLKAYPTQFTSFPGRNSVGNPFLDPTITGAGLTNAVPCIGKSCYLTNKPITGTNIFANNVINTNVIGCCFPTDTVYFNREELAKLRWRFSQNTSLTAAYLGTQSIYSQTGSQLYTAGNIFFTPPANYTGPIPAQSNVQCCGQTSPSNIVYLQSIWEGEFRTTFKNTSFLARYYSGYIRSWTNGPTQVPGSQTYGPLQLYGGLPLGTAATPTAFNGETGYVLFSPNSTNSVQLLDFLGGFTAELNQTAGQNLYTLAFDFQANKTGAYTDFFSGGGTTAPPTYILSNFVANGTKQYFRTVSARALLALNPKLTLDLADYQLGYQSIFSTDGGVTFKSSQHSYNAPRAAISYRPNPNTAWRFSLGSSIAPPYVRQISSGTFPPFPNSVTNPQFYTQSQNSGNLNAETSFGYDFGGDFRLGNAAMRRAGREVIASFDGYLSNIRNQFYTTTSIINPAYTDPQLFPGNPPLPLYATRVVNIGQARYMGLEASLRQTPPLGMGWMLQGALIRAYVYNIPPGFYSTPAGGAFATNLGVVANVNFNGSAATGGQNGVWTGSGNGRVPYAMGYGELNYRTPSGIYANVGSTYYGNNNSYNWPAFFVYSANVRFPVWKSTTLSLTGDNLTGVHSQALPCIDCGIPVPLANGMVSRSVGVNLGPPTWRAFLNWQL